MNIGGITGHALTSETSRVWLSTGLSEAQIKTYVTAEIPSPLNMASGINTRRLSENRQLATLFAQGNSWQDNLPLIFPFSDTDHHDAQTQVTPFQ